MTKLHQVYECQVCGNRVEVIKPGAGTLVCCDQPMKLYEENTVDASTEKHVPVITKTENGYRVQVGSALHPMIPEHYIEWIELVADGMVYRKYLKPGEEPVAEFITDAKEVYAREFCNLHGLWKSN
ncbi:MAG TPA: desulfoferrodoxin [Firmicutes bacterium]|nr:desulfoferrodoxin [Bacillota bacterium]